jgi:hypothetical protein
MSYHKNHMVQRLSRDIWAGHSAIVRSNISNQIAYLRGQNIWPVARVIPRVEKKLVMLSMNTNI